MRKDLTTLHRHLRRFVQKVETASLAAAELKGGKKRTVLFEAARLIEARSASILEANAKDLKAAERSGFTAAFIDRLTLDKKRLYAMAHAVREVADLKEPVHQVLKQWRRPNGLKISKITVPLGIILIIYESRPNVTSECASLCFKSGNGVLLRGGREAIHTNRAIVKVYREAFAQHGIPREIVSLVPVPDRSAIDALLKMDDLINLVIPRGGEALIRRVARGSRIPVIKHDKGICHVYVDRDADLRKALEISLNAKCQRTGVCNAMETLLVHERIAARFLPEIGRRLRAAGCEVRGDQTARRYIPDAKRAAEEDWRTEYLANILSIRVVKDEDEAIRHIQKYGSQHTDAIVSDNKKAAAKFAEQVDSSSVMVNASTRFSDGNEYGFGAEIGISTEKIHARGPMGVEGLLSYKYVVEGSGQIRS